MRARVRFATVSVRAAVLTSYDPWDDRTSRSRGSAALGLVALLGLLALGISGYALLHVRGELASERRARAAAVAELRRELLTVRASGSALAGRVASAEQQLKRRDGGVAPLAARVLRSVFTVETDTSLGSGFVAWTDGGASYVLTAYHVLEDDSGGTVTISRKGSSWSGQVDAVDPKNDLALVRVNGRPAGAAPLWQDAGAAALPRAGDELLLVGSPYGLYGTVTTGIVSRVTPRTIQTDAAANPGNSGGPTLDKRGRIVGVLLSGSGENLNFAVPIERACQRLRSC